MASSAEKAFCIYLPGFFACAGLILAAIKTYVGIRTLVLCSGIHACDNHCFQPAALLCFVINYTGRAAPSLTRNEANNRLNFKKLNAYKMTRYCFTLDLKNDDALIAEYERHHTAIPPGVMESFSQAGIENLELYRAGIRLFMIFDVNDSFSFERKDEIDRNNTAVQEWERLMAKYQEAAPGALPGEKWVMMKRIFRL